MRREFDVLMMVVFIIAIHWGIPKSATRMAAAKSATGIMTNVSTVGSTVAIAGLSPFFWPRHRLAFYYMVLTSKLRYRPGHRTPHVEFSQLPTVCQLHNQKII